MLKVGWGEVASWTRPPRAGLPEGLGPGAQQWPAGGAGMGVSSQDDSVLGSKPPNGCFQGHHLMPFDAARADAKTGRT